ncbi:hypothetical protein [Leifsonia sp. 21MFCrub1.1]|uniref:hypothetical protein n=1 Tax=Leifsonia sp. 21MFCrub1.1 TaxID=1798223 RepID=UPI0012FDD6C0|nr:hypothetical protein [Leifsonia sp. 21MFCrub1.1]
MAGNDDDTNQKLTITAPAGSVNSRSGIVWIDGNPGERWTQLERAIEQFVTLAKGEPAKLASFDSEVHALVKSRFGGDPLLAVEDLRTYNPKPAVQWPGKAVPLELAFRTLTTALQRSDSKMRMTNLRPAMGRVDPRFAKDANPQNPLNVVGIWGALVRAAEKAGLVTQSGPASNPYISLVEPLSPPQAAATALKDANARESDRYLGLLKAAALGPFQQVRTAVYREIERKITRSTSITVGELLDGAVQKVRHDVEAAHAKGKDYLLSQGKALPWSTVRGFIAVMFIRQPVLLSDNEPVPADWVHLDTPVSGMVDDWQLRVDGDLVAHLVGEGCRIDQYSDVELSGALYNQRQDLSQVHAVLKYLVENGICELAPDYSLRLT